MCTCGIDIATQQATPATHSSACSTPRRQAERPRRRAGSPARGCRRDGCCSGGRAPQHEARAAASSATQNDADADVGLAPADGLDEVLHDRRPDRAGEVVAARADRHRDAAPAHEPERGVGDQRREAWPSCRAADQQRRARARTPTRLAAQAGGDEAEAERRPRR